MYAPYPHSFYSNNTLHPFSPPLSSLFSRHINAEQDDGYSCVLSCHGRCCDFVPHAPCSQTQVIHPHTPPCNTNPPIHPIIPPCSTHQLTQRLAPLSHTISSHPLCSPYHQLNVPTHAILIPPSIPPDQYPLYDNTSHHFSF